MYMYVQHSTIAERNVQYCTFKVQIKLALNCCLSNDYPVQNSTFNKWLSFIEIYYLHITKLSLY